jgi:hypothetical protein
MPELRRYAKFRSQREFAVVETALVQHLSEGRWVALSPPATVVAGPYQPTTYYQSLGLTQVRALSKPDNAWHGYFLPLAEA